MAKEDNMRQVRGLMNRPGPPMVGRSGEKSRDFRGTMRKVMAYVRPERRGLLTVFAFAILSTGFSIVGPRVMGLAVDKLYDGVVAKMNHVAGAHIDFRYIGYVLAALLGIYLLSALFGYVQEYIIAGVSQKIILRMRSEVAAKLHRLPLKYFDTHTYGEILSRVTNDIDTISTTLQQSVTQLITAIITIVGITVMMLTINVWLTVVAFMVLPLSFGLTAIIAKRSQRFYKGQQRSLGELNGKVEETYGGHEVIRAFNYQGRAVSEFNTNNRRLYTYGWRAQFVSSFIFPLINFLGNVTFVGVCVVGGYMTAIGRMTLGGVQAFITYARQFHQPILQISNIINILQTTVAAAERVFEVLDEPEGVPDPAHPEQIGRVEGDVRFDHIRFSYSPDKPLIEDLSLEARPGSVVAIVGPTGAGKTTLVNLLMRFYELDGGRITIDGVDISHMKRKYLRALFGMVLQDTWLFGGTIRENIAYGKAGATDEEVVRAAKMALADDFIRALPEGYDTVINENDSNISQGQRQLLTIARAVLVDPAILILDEATSSVDTRTEILIQKAMESLMKGRTSFVIAHRLSTIRDADNILVMNNGSIVEQGAHRALLAAGGFYAQLYNSQFDPQAAE